METFDVGSHYNTINGSILKVIEVRDTIVAFGAVSLAEEDTELGNQMCYYLSVKFV